MRNQAARYFLAPLMYQYPRVETVLPEVVPPPDGLG
jgi:hypothetical protein